MRDIDGAYGGEMSAHHYFRDFMYCDSGMIPWVLVLSALAQSGKTLKEEIDAMRAAYPSSGELNFRVDGAAEIMAAIEDEYRAEAAEIDHLDGLSMAFDSWRFNLRRSNTEPLLRLNVETRGDPERLTTELAKLRHRIEAGAAR